MGLVHTEERISKSFGAIHAAVTSADPVSTAKFIVEAVLELDNSETVAEIAADFIEDEIGRFDWKNNWEVIKTRENPVKRVQDYLNNYSIVADAEKIVNYIDLMTVENPGRWK